MTHTGSQVERPVTELKGFAEAKLEPGETESVTFELPAASLGYYDTEAGAWVVEPITYQVYVGASSRAQDLLEAEFRIIRDD